MQAGIPRLSPEKAGLPKLLRRGAQAYGLSGPVSTLETNIAETWNVLEACRRSLAVKGIVLASSDQAYGDHEQLPYNEDTPLQEWHPYDVSKSCADLIAQAYATTYGSPVAITRCGNFYGAGDLNWNRIIPGAVRAGVRGERPIIRSEWAVYL